MSLLDYSHLLTTEEIAKKLGYHPQYVRSLAAQGKIPAIKRFRKWLFDEAKVAEFFKSQTEVSIKGGKNASENNTGSDILR